MMFPFHATNKRMSSPYSVVQTMWDMRLSLFLNINLLCVCQECGHQWGSLSTPTLSGASSHLYTASGSPVTSITPPQGRWSSLLPPPLSRSQCRRAGITVTCQHLWLFMWVLEAELRRSGGSLLLPYRFWGSNLGHQVLTS